MPRTKAHWQREEYLWRGAQLKLERETGRGIEGKQMRLGREAGIAYAADAGGFQKEAGRGVKGG